MEEQIKLIDNIELSKRLGISPKTVEKKWREWPHVMVGTGHTLRSARFDYNDVLAYLKGGTKQEG